MSSPWVAGVVRAKALARRRLGAAGARAVATAPGLGAALAALSSSSYGRDVRPDQRLAAAQHTVGASLLWNMRVLAGWLPRGRVDVVRLFAAGFEVANLDEHLCTLHHLSSPQRVPSDPPYTLGMLDTAWSRLSSTTALTEVARVLETSRWQLRGCTTPRELALGLRLAWADAVVGGVPEAAGVGAGSTSGSAAPSTTVPFSATPLLTALAPPTWPAGRERRRAGSSLP